MRASHHTLLRELALTPRPMPRSRILTTHDRPPNGRYFSMRCRCSFYRVATFRLQTSVFLLITPHSSYVTKLDDGPLHHAVLPNLLGWFGISRPPSFPPSLGVLGSHDPGVVPGVYDHVLRSLRCHPQASSGRNRLTCTWAFSVNDTSYSRTTLSLATSAVARGSTAANRLVRGADLVLLSVRSDL